MHRFIVKTLMAALVLCAGWFLTGLSQSQAEALNSAPPPLSSHVRLVFIHHSVGGNWLNDGLFTQLNVNNYYVTDTDYGWGPDIIGEYTDIGHWYNWFLGPSSATYLTALYNNTHEPWPNIMTPPALPNTVVLFKSCYPNSGGISGSPNDPPRISSAGNPNPIWGADAYNSEAVTVANVKGMYRDLLSYFATRQDRLFILLTPPPITADEQMVVGSSDRARAINTWLVNHWLDGYPYNNVAVFDFFNVLTSNGGGINTNDLGATTGNHHRLLSGRVQHLVQTGNNYAAYPSGDSHPTLAGNTKATGEFVPLLNVAYHAWQGTGGRPFYMGRSPKPSPASDLLLLSDLTLTSSAFANGGLIPDKYTLMDNVGALNISIPLAWTNPPSGTRSFALSMVDKFPAANNWVHWLAINMSASATHLDEGASIQMPAGTIQLNNSWQTWQGYGGPYTTSDPHSLSVGLHSYEIKIYALNVPTLNLPVATSLTAFQAALEGKVLESASLTGNYFINVP